MELSQDLHAMHDLIFTFEAAKANIDDLLDFNITGIFAIVTQDGLIARSNEELAKLLETNCELVIGRNISEIFKTNDWDIFKKELLNLEEVAGTSPNGLELQVFQNGRARRISFSSRIISNTQILDTKYFVVLGNDITEIIDLLTKNSILSKNNELLLNTNQNLDIMLNSLNQGLLLVNAAGICSEQVSKASVDIFGFNPAGQHITKVLNLSPQESSTIEKWLHLMFTTPNMVLSLIDLAPVKLNNDRQREITLAFKPVLDTDGSLLHLMLIATDRTAEHNALKKMKEADEYAQMVLKIIKYRDDFLNEIATMQGLIDQVLALSNRSPLTQEVLSQIKFNTHTIKGISGYLSMIKLQDACHRFESKLSEENVLAKFDTLKNEYIPSVQDTFSQLASEVKKILGLNEEDVHSVKREISYSFLKSTYEKLAAAESTKHEFAKEFYYNFVCVAVEEIFSPFERQVNYLAKRLDKKISPLKIITNGIRIDPQEFRKILTELVHIFRNIVDHGIEKAEKRIAAGKSPEGKILIECNKKSESGQEYFIFNISDDGSGIDTEKLKARLAEQGRDIAAMTEKEIQHTIFEAGISTADTITDLSGRGVGMSALKQAIDEAQGTIEVFSMPGKGCQFQIKIPFCRPVA